MQGKHIVQSQEVQVAHATAALEPSNSFCRENLLLVLLRSTSTAAHPSSMATGAGRAHGASGERRGRPGDGRAAAQRHLRRARPAAGAPDGGQGAAGAR